MELALHMRQRYAVSVDATTSLVSNICLRIYGDRGPPALIHESKWLATGATAYQTPGLPYIKFVRFDISGDNIVYETNLITRKSRQVWLCQSDKLPLIIAM